MSRIGKKPVAIPSGVTVKIDGQVVEVSGPKTKQPLCWSIPGDIRANLDNGDRTVVVTRSGDEKRSRSLHGLTRALIANMVRGAATGYERRLLIFGTGYSCKVEGQFLELNIGFMGRGTKQKPQFRVPIPQGLDIVIETPASRGDTDPAKLLIKGADKQLVGAFAAEVRSLRPPEPYKGKGIRYDDEKVQR